MFNHDLHLSDHKEGVRHKEHYDEGVELHEGLFHYLWFAHTETHERELRGAHIEAKSKSLPSARESKSEKGGGQR